MERADAIVVTGEGTGKETPLDKIKRFREKIGDFPLVVGAGVDSYNVMGQLKIADGAIIGSYFKKGYTWNHIDPFAVKNFMEIVRDIRRNN